MTEQEKLYCEAKELIKISKKDRKKGIKILKALDDYAPAQYLLAVFLKGKRKKNNSKVMGLLTSALLYYQSATEKDNAEKQVRLGSYYYYGDMGLEKNVAEAVKWFTISANNGDPKAQMILAKCYAIGDGVEKSMPEFMNWIQKAAEQNEPDALAALGHSYAMGNGVEKDLIKSVELLKKAMNLGSMKALKIYRWLVLAKEIEG